VLDSRARAATTAALPVSNGALQLKAVRDEPFGFGVHSFAFEFGKQQMLMGQTTVPTMSVVCSRPQPQPPPPCKTPEYKTYGPMVGRPRDCVVSTLPQNELEHGHLLMRGGVGGKVEKEEEAELRHPHGRRLRSHQPRRAKAAFLSSTVALASAEELAAWDFNQGELGQEDMRGALEKTRANCKTASRVAMMAHWGEEVEMKKKGGVSTPCQSTVAQVKVRSLGLIRVKR